MFNFDRIDSYGRIEIQHWEQEICIDEDDCDKGKARYLLETRSSVDVQDFIGEECVEDCYDWGQTGWNVSLESIYHVAVCIFLRRYTTS